MEEKIKCLVVLGPTSAGKSAVAIKLARKFNGEVISADSRQVYRGLDLGTGKVEGKWMPNKANYSQKSPVLKSPKKEKVFVSEGIIHHLIDFRSPRGQYNASHFQKDCKSLIKDIANRRKIPIICGGTGFWISAAVNNMQLPKVKPNRQLRSKLAKKTPGQLFAQLRKVDPQRAQTIDGKNKHRLIRAIEIAKTLGKVPRLDNTKPRNTESKFLQIGIDWPQEKLDEKIEKRLQTRWMNGMVNEIKRLRKKYGLSWKKIQSFGLAYFWIPEHLRGNIDLEQLKVNVFRAERNYAKRQRTWFKRDKRIIWQNDYSKISELAEEFINK